MTASTLTQYNILAGGASNAISSITPSTSGYVLTSNGATANPTFQALPATSISITGNTGGTLTGNSFTFSGGTQMVRYISPLTFKAYTPPGDKDSIVLLNRGT